LSQQREAFRLRDTLVRPGERRVVQLGVARLYDHTRVQMNVSVIHGKRPGPVLFVSAAIHGDEINGVEIIRRLLGQRAVQERLRGTLLAIPIVNVFGFNNKSRYLPDRRDLNRSFPGSRTGSLAARLAHTFMREIVDRASHGIDLHTGAIHRTNLPQIRALLDAPETRRLALAFGAPVTLNSSTRDGSLRQAALERNLPILLYEGGEALRFDEVAIRYGVTGILAVMREIGMLPRRKSARKSNADSAAGDETASGTKTQATKSFIASSSQWIRAPRSGIFRPARQPGQHVRAGDILGVVAGPLGEKSLTVRSPVPGLVIGRLQLPLVNRGDALFQIAAVDGAVSGDLQDFLQPDDIDRLYNGDSIEEDPV
jgi:hypothetical protein